MLGLILFHTAFGLPFAIFLLRNFFIGIPKDILESARIDGASELRIFLRLILPLGLPAIASLAIFQFLWTWNDLLVALTFGRDTQPITVAIFSQLRQFGSNIELIAPASFLSLVVPLAVFFAFQRYFVAGAAGGLGEVSVAGVAIVGGGLAGFIRLPDAAPRRARARRDRRLRRRARPGGRVGAAGGGDPADADALRERRALPADVVPRARRARGACGGGRSARSLRERRATATTRRSRSSSSTSRELRGRSGWDESVRVARASSGSAPVDGRLRARRRTERSATCSSRPAIPGLNVPDELRGDPRAVHAYEPHEYARRRDRRRRRAGGRDRVAERARRRRAVVSVRRREPVRRPLNVPRAAASRAAGSTASTGRRRRARRPSCARCSRRRTRPGARWDEPLARARRGRFRVEPQLNGAEQVICATGFRRGFAARPAARAARRRARARDATSAGSCSTPDCDGARPHGRARGRSPLAGVRRSGRFPAADTLVGAKYAARGVPPEGAGMSYTLRGRIESRLAPRSLPLLAALRARGRARSAGGRSSSPR